MARIPFQNKTEQHLAMKQESNRAGENNDCTVMAVATACGVTYKKAHEAMKSVGRQKGQGVYIKRTKRAVESLGFRMILVPRRNMICKYPKPHNNLQSITTHHPDRFWKVWQDGKSYILSQSGHITAVVNGVNHDWTRGRAKRVVALYEIVRK